MAALSMEDRVLVALRRITRATDLHSRGLMQEFGLTAPQLAALRAIAGLQPVTAGALAKSIHLSQATLSGILARLETRGLVTRARSGADRRSVVVQLTAQGDTVLQSAPSPLHDRFRRGLLKLRDWEQTQMLSALQRVAAMMETEERGTALGEHVPPSPTAKCNAQPCPPNSFISTPRSDVESTPTGDRRSKL